MAEQRDEQLMELEERYARYEVYDRNGEKIGKVGHLFVDENDRPEYIGVKTGLFGLKSTLIPREMIRIDEERRRIEVAESKDRVKDAPDFDDEEEITLDHEREIYSYFGLERAETADNLGCYGAPYGAETDERTGERHQGVAVSDVDRKRAEFHEHPASPEQGGVTERSSDLRNEDELRVQRTEEELRAGTREREAGSVRVRKRVRTDRERLRVPKKQEEVRVDRVPVNREVSEAEIGENEFFVPVTEEEVVVEKRPVVREEIRLRKDVVEDEEVVERDVRKEEVDIDDQTKRSRHRGRRSGEYRGEPEEG